jgi:tetratricopeptide (TPR) repeat protein
LREVMLADDATQDEVGGWITANNAAGTNQVSAEDLNKRIRERLEVQRKNYERFLRNHPDSAHGFLAYGSFLNDIGDEEGSKVQYENSKQLDPKNPAVWNNLANYYGEYSPVTNAFAYYAEAIRLNPNEPVYYQNFATTVYLFRKDAREFYHINEQQVFDKALGLYQQAMKLAPDNFVFATDFAESYYGIKPLRTNDALVAWTNAFSLARTENERQAVQLHFARVNIAAGFYDEAQAHLAAVTNAAFADLKNRLARSLIEHKNAPTNTVEAAPADDIVTGVIPPETGTNVPVLPSNLLTMPPPLRERKEP